MILGIDEVGRGPWAGPLVVGAVVLGSEPIAGLTDSKKLSKVRREHLSNEIYSKAAGIGIGFVHSDELDEIGLSAALRLATVRAVEQVHCFYSEIIIDGTINFLSETKKGMYVTTLKKADLLISSVSAASIIAKVARDAYMEEMDVKYPVYGFARHVGYGTAAHRTAIESHGITPLHRRSFAPLKHYSKTSPNEMTRTIRTTKIIGDEAETITTKYLLKENYIIVERNWKTKFCEIDIVAKKDQCYYFFEVKHRKNVLRGGGIAAITAKKLRQMKFAAELYGQYRAKKTESMRLGVVTTTGEQPPVVEGILLLE